MIDDGSELLVQAKRRAAALADRLEQDVAELRDAQNAAHAEGAHLAEQARQAARRLADHLLDH